MIGKIGQGYESILSYDALSFLGCLHREFYATRNQLMEARAELQMNIDAGHQIKVFHSHLLFL